MPLPRDFLDEVETELQSARHALVADAVRIGALEELRQVADAVATHLGRPVSVFDVVRSPSSRAERARRASLVRLLRQR